MPLVFQQWCLPACVKSVSGLQMAACCFCLLLACSFSFLFAPTGLYNYHCAKQASKTISSSITTNSLNFFCEICIFGFSKKLPKINNYLLHIFNTTEREQLKIRQPFIWIIEYKEQKAKMSISERHHTLKIILINSVGGVQTHITHTLKSSLSQAPAFQHMSSIW